MHFSSEVSRWREDGRLISIFDDNFDRRVFKGAPAAETRVRMDIELPLSVYRIFWTKIQRLQEM